VHPVGSNYTDISRCTVDRTLNLSVVVREMNPNLDI